MIGAEIHKEQVTFKTYAQKLPPSSSSSGGGNAEPAVDPRLLGIFKSAFEKLSQNAQELMQLCSLLANTDVPIKLLQGSEGVYVFDWMKGGCYHIFTCWVHINRSNQGPPFSPFIEHRITVLRRRNYNQTTRQQGNQEGRYRTSLLFSHLPELGESHPVDPPAGPQACRHYS